jgi:hypothetical protein
MYWSLCHHLNSSTMLGRSVYFRKPSHSQLYWAVRRWKILNTRKLFKAASSILNSVLHVTEVHYFGMKTEGRKLSQCRFGSVIFLFRMVGIPCKMKKISTIYAIYMITVIISASTTYVGMFVDVYIHREDLGRAMSTMRVLIGYTNTMWTFSICR